MSMGIRLKLPTKGMLKYGVYGGNYVKALQAKLDGVMDFAHEITSEQFGRTYETWDNKPEFKEEKSYKIGQMNYKYYTNDKVYGYVNNGTRQHIIKARKSTYDLAFTWAGVAGRNNAKTFPNVIGSVAASPPNYAFFSGPFVDHPRVAARNFDKIIHDRVRPKIVEATRRAFSQWMRE